MLKLIKAYNEGAKVYYCLNCKHKVVIAKDKRVYCVYCNEFRYYK